MINGSHVAGSFIDNGPQSQLSRSVFEKTADVKKQREGLLQE